MALAPKFKYKSSEMDQYMKHGISTLHVQIK